jgi:isopenicillin-N epimerase
VSWILDPDVVHLNHGSYGGCPRAVVDTAAALRLRLEASPMRFFVLDWQRELDAARAALAAFVRAPDDRLVFTPNATTACALALGAAELAAGDEIVITDHAYRAVKNQVVRLAEARGARVAIARLALPFDPDQAVAALAAARTPNTRLLVIDHITSPTGIVLPLERIVAAYAGTQILVDGAHAPGQIALDIAALGVTWYAGNNHKWLCAPKGSGFLYTSTPLRPAITSHGASPEYGPPNRLHAELDWAGSHDPAAHLAVPVAIAAIEQLAGSWSAARAHNHALVLELRDRVIAGLGATQLAPDTSLGAMAAIPIALPAGTTPLAMTQQLLRDGWEVPIVDWHAGPLVRVSAHLYNTAAQGDALAAKLRALGIRAAS